MSKVILPRSLSRVFKQGDVVKVLLDDDPQPTLSLAINDCEWALLDFDVKGDEYQPCIIIPKGWCGQKLDVLSVQGLRTSQKRKYEHRVIESNYAKLWNDPCFTDAAVVCGDKSFAVHRSVLSQASRVFAKAFSSTMLEGQSAKLDMTGEDPVAVAALLEHAYTTKLRADANPQTLLPLADRYELYDCVDDCVAVLLAFLPTSPVDVVRALRPYSRVKRVRRTWESMCDAVADDRNMLATILESL